MGYPSLSPVELNDGLLLTAERPSNVAHEAFEAAGMEPGAASQ